MNRPIITSLLDTDLYKLTMQEAVWKAHRGAQAKYELILRYDSARFDERFKKRLLEQVEAMGDLSLSGEEADWLKSLGWFEEEYLAAMREYSFAPEQVGWEGDRLLVSGPWFEAILWEVPLLALVTELYFSLLETDWSMSVSNYVERTRKKAKRFAAVGCLVAEFGTRRRRSLALQEAALEGFADHGSTLSGTSNLMLARKFGLRPIGTMAHEWIMAHAVWHGVARANQNAFEEWLAVHQGAHAIALADTYTHQLFFQNFGRDLAERYAGVRHDSGDPFQFGQDLKAHYRRLGIDPAEKKLVFSDGLDVDSAVALQQAFGTVFQCSFGIGTFLTNDIPESPPLDVVIKLVELDGKPAVKLSDAPGKASGDRAAVVAARQAVEQAVGGGSAGIESVKA